MKQRDFIFKMEKEKCKHEDLVLSIVASQKAHRLNGEWDYEGVADIERDNDAYKEGCYAWCINCDRYLTKQECEEIGVD
jgi:hypothetical protein